MVSCGVRVVILKIIAHTFLVTCQKWIRTIDQSKGLYVPGDYAGSQVLKIFMNRYLRGSKGSSYILKDNLGREIESLDDGKS